MIYTLIGKVFKIILFLIVSRSSWFNVINIKFKVSDPRSSNLSSPIISTNLNKTSPKSLLFILACKSSGIFTFGV